VKPRARHLLVVLVSSVLAVGLLPPAVASADGPPDGVIFNRPADAGNFREKYAIRTHVEAAFDAVPPGGTIRVAMWAINFESSAKRLIEAHERGVSVQVIIDDRHDYLAQRQLRAALGSDRAATSFIHVCLRGCQLDRGGAMHSKFITLTQSGDKQNVVMSSTANLTGPGATWGWNDINTWSGNEVWYAGFVDTFERMKLDQHNADPFRVVQQGPNTVYFFPQPGASLSEDPIARALSSVRCRGATDGAGINGRTVIRVMMFGATGPRGLYLARRLTGLDAAGCLVQVILAKPGDKVIRELRRPGVNGGVTVHDSRYDRDGDGRPDKYVHFKTMMISGNYAGDSSGWAVFTGSQNWFTRSQTFDSEVVVEMRERGKYGLYDRHFRDIWNNHSYLRRNKPLSAYSTASQSEGSSQADPWPYMGPLPESR
jgi:phosphatidylserine/phosphatidylglycerophosphate/cardiolipin synthase-like enzyme